MEALVIKSLGSLSGKQCTLMPVFDIWCVLVGKRIQCVHYTFFFFKKIELNPVSVVFWLSFMSLSLGGLFTITSAWCHTDLFQWNPVRWS